MNKYRLYDNSGQDRVRMLEYTVNATSAWHAEAGVRRLSPGNEVDIALVRPDGVLHVVELTRANVQTVKLSRDNPVPSAEVHDAVAQVANYLRDFDEQRQLIQEKFGLDARRASATVVVGQPDFDTAFTEQQVNEALRTYVSHLSRIDVMTYKQLIDSARRSLGSA
ncbi:uncharacterized protein DUF4263 [Actinokineospora auranticolor]|uniref:Uncharacterized protein DUF4263 n=2 Tax=Actinokineospora auranticolor TaxID=155976 RepID=A0A2S6GRT4_9PSEU|nr:uncharacterized protein DUF4263 [Actinokineospora auranticolor]